jgi:hypothetical protein
MGRVNHRLPEERIRSTYRELVAKHGGVSGRRLREELRRRFGAVGKTERVFRIWREELGAGAPDQGALIRRLQEQVSNLSQQLSQARKESAETAVTRVLRRDGRAKAYGH